MGLRNSRDFALFAQGVLLNFWIDGVQDKNCPPPVELRYYRMYIAYENIYPFYRIEAAFQKILDNVEY